MGILEYSKTLTNDTTADATDVQTMFNEVASVVNGGLGDANMDATDPLDADKIQDKFLRNDGDDSTSGSLTITTNNKGFRGVTTGAAAKNIGRINSNDEVELGDATQKMVLKASETPQFSDGVQTIKMWSEANDGAGSGLDADKVDGYDTSTGTTKNTIPIRDANGKLPGSITGDAATLGGKTLAQVMVPIGGIIMWSGSIGSIPAGWHLCDGTNGTPDLRDRFIVGAGSEYSVGATGGAKEVTLTVEQMPNHKHTYTRNSSNGGGVFGGGDVLAAGLTYSADTTSTGGGQAHENRPPYYALAFIMHIG